MSGGGGGVEGDAEEEGGSRGEDEGFWRSQGPGRGGVDEDAAGAVEWGGEGLKGEEEGETNYVGIEGLMILRRRTMWHVDDDARAVNTRALAEYLQISSAADSRSTRAEASADRAPEPWSALLGGRAQDLVHYGSSGQSDANTTLARRSKAWGTLFSQARVSKRPMDIAAGIKYYLPASGMCDCPAEHASHAPQGAPASVSPDFFIILDLGTWSSRDAIVILARQVRLGYGRACPMLDTQHRLTRY